MGIFDKLFGNNKTESGYLEPEHSVIVHFQYRINKLEPLHNLEKELEQIIEKEGVGEYDGHEIAMDYSDGFLYMYGKNADDLFNSVKPTLENSDFMKGAIVTLRFGQPEDGVREIVVKL